MKIVMRNISELKPAEYNPRRLTEKQFLDLKQSMENLDILEPAVINKFAGRVDVIVSGHQRLKVAKKLGIKEYPCVEVFFPLEKEREANIRLNKNTGEWDYELLTKEFKMDDLFEFGFEAADFDFEKEGGEGGDDGAKGGLKGKEYDKMFKLEIDCLSEEDQMKVFEEMVKRGYECRVLIL